jgi:hypothetical protein
LTGFSKKIGTRPKDIWKTITTLTAVSHKLKDIELDLTDNAVTQKLVKDEDINHRLHHASIALGAEELQLFVTMFTEFFQVIEGETNLQDYDKYSALRDVLSHTVLDPNRAMKWVNHNYRHPDHFEFISFCTRSIYPY